MNCRFVREHLDALLDGELEPGAAIDMERHLEACVACAERAEAERAWRRQLREALSEVRAPATLRLRVLAALEAEASEEGEDVASSAAPAATVHRLPWRRWGRETARWAVPAAAAVVIFVGLDAVPPGLLGNPVRKGGLGPAALQDVVRLHVGRLPADVHADDPQRLESFVRRQVGFPARPVRFSRSDVRLVGARAWHVRGRHAAAYYYRTRDGRRLTVVAFRGEPPREMGVARVLYGGKAVGYARLGRHVVSVRRAGDVNYAFVGDMDRRSLLRMVAASRPASFGVACGGGRSAAPRPGTPRRRAAGGVPLH